jgi:hypothetical protein
VRTMCICRSKCRLTTNGRGANCHAIVAGIESGSDDGLRVPQVSAPLAAQMQVNQYVKVSQAAGLVDEAEEVLRRTLVVPVDEEGVGNGTFRPLGTVWTGRIAQATVKYGENAPMSAVCCNACRTCVTTNAVSVALVAVAAAVHAVVRFARRAIASPA